MSPTHLPPTPVASGELTIKESSFQTMETMSEHSFALPPAALSPVMTDNNNSHPASRKDSLISQTPVSPASPGVLERKSSTSASSRVGTKRAAATAASSSTALDEFNLPPPPTRSRKIIQMKPKTIPSSSNTTATTTKQPSQKKAATPKSGSTSVPKNGSTTATTSPSASINTTTASPTIQQSSNSNGSKRKQPSATSAAGRKIARKTAHSLIERRRRSKMNEEFATLKNMIPACRGQEMHKLAILQASIDYMNYLEECITELKNNASSAGRTSSISKKPKLEGPPMAPPSPTSPEMIIPPMTSEESVESGSGSESPEPLSQNNNNNASYSTTSTYYSSPSFSPYIGPTTSQQQIQSLDGVAHPILPSPALRPIYSPQIQAQTQHSDSQQTSNSNKNSVGNRTSWRVQQQIASTTPSPAILPQQHRQSVSSHAASMASPVFIASDSMIDHEASAALLMLNMDRRGASISEEGDDKSPNSNERKMGMSVRDLLTS